MKTLKRKFNILTLSDCLGCGDSGYRSLSDPITIIMGGITALTALFPNLFGGGRVRLTNADWLKMFPGNGMWTVRLRNHLQGAIHYNVDLGNIEPYTRYFVDDNKSAFCESPSFEVCFQMFLQIIEEEKFSGGKSPGGRIPGIPGTFDYMSLLPYALGGLVLLMVLRRN